MKQDDLDAPHRTDVSDRRARIATALFATIAIVMAIDIVSDARAGTDWEHLATEGGAMALALAGVVALWRGFREASRRAARLDVDLVAARRAADRFREEAREALAGLGQAIDTQFERWALTPAEREVALLMLKGLSHREVAEVRATSEATVRQQALSVYRKAGLRNRSDLSAFFLEDLLLPRVETRQQP